MKLYDDIHNDVELQELLVEDTHRYLDELKKHIPDEDALLYELVRAHRELFHIKATEDFKDA